MRAWTLLEGAELTLEAPTYKGIGRVIAKTLQSEEVHNQVLAVDSTLSSVASTLPGIPKQPQC